MEVCLVLQMVLEVSRVGGLWYLPASGVVIMVCLVVVSLVSGW